MSNNPFAAAMNEPESYVHHREPPPVPRANNGGSHITPPPRPPKSETAAAPPAYDEITISDKSRREYPREKSSSSESRTRRSGSENRPDRPERPDRPDRLDRPDRPDRPERSDKERAERHRLSKSRREHTSRDPSSRDPSREHRDPSSKEHRHSSGASSKPREHRSKKSPSKKKVEPIKPKNLDTIDKLDVTGFFGGGFHHDGPFDACTPHRNKNVKSAPVMAFPPDGPNNSIKGMGNIAKEKEKQMDLAFGNYNDDQNEIIGRRTSIKRSGGSNDYVEVRSASIGPSSGSNPNGSSTEVYTANPSIINFDARVKAIPVHGSTTAGLGSTTFIDGAPAPKGAEEYLSTSGGGLNRKKSLVQRLRKNSASENSSRRNSNEGGAANNGSNSPIYSPDSSRRGSLNHTETNDNDLAPPPSTGTASSLLRRVKSLKVRR